MIVLLVLTPTRDNTNAVEKALNLAKGGKMFLLYVVDKKIPDSVGAWLLYLGFLGSKLEKDIEEIITVELSKRGEERIQEIRDKARVFNIDLQYKLVPGPLWKTVKEVADLIKPDRIIMASETKGVSYDEEYDIPPIVVDEV